MPDTFSITELNQHPFAIYTRESVAARDKVVEEITRLTLLIDDESVSEDERVQANKDLPVLTAEIGRMDEADRAFIARVVVGPFPPKDDVVERTIELNKNLAEVVVDANRARAIIRLVTEWTNDMRAVVTGEVPALPSAATPSASASAPSPAAPTAPAAAGTPAAGGLR